MHLTSQELWTLLASASEQAIGIPKKILDDKAEELRIKNEAQKAIQVCYCVLVDYLAICACSLPSSSPPATKLVLLDSSPNIPFCLQHHLCIRLSRLTCDKTGASTASLSAVLHISTRHWQIADARLQLLVYAVSACVIEAASPTTAQNSAAIPLQA